MLVFMSDLHFVDGSAGDHNVKKSAFELVFRRIADRALKARAETIEVVLLGDTVDLLRTEYWFQPQVLDHEKPWALDDMDRNRLVSHTAEVLSRISQANRETFALFRGLTDYIREEQETPVTTEVRVTYLPGNHDRLLSLDDAALMNPLLAQLGATLPTAGNRYLYDNPEYRVTARHGHEFDAWNFENADDVDIDNLTPADYLLTPIGDPITTELVTRLPFLVAERLKGDPEVDTITARLQEIDNVRPLSSVLKWLFFQFKDDREAVRQAVEAAIDQAADDFRALPYVKWWFDKHDKFLRPDKADALQAVLAVADHLQITKAETLFKAVDIGGRLRTADPLVTAAETELLKSAAAGRNRAYLIYGHTHKPKQVAVDVVEDGNRRIEQIYLNTGTFRARHHEARRRGFITWKQLTYITLYSKKESIAMGGTPGDAAFESWTGARQER